MHNGSVFRRTVRSLTRPAVFLVTLVFGNLFSAITGILVSLAVRDAVNAFLYRQHQEEVAAFWLASVCALLILVSTPLSAFVCNTLSKRTSMSFRNAVFRSVTRLSLSALDAKSAANVLSVATNDAAQLESIFDGGLHWLVSPAVTGGLCLATAVWLNWRLACVQLAVLSLSNLSASHLKAPLGRTGCALQETLGEVVATYGEILQGVSAIRLYRLHDAMDQRFALVNDEVLRHRETLAKQNGVIDGVDQLFLGLAYLGVLGAGSWLVLKGGATWGTVAAILGLQAGVGDLGAIGGAWSRLQSQLSGAERVYELLDLDDGSDSRVSAAPLSASRAVTPRGAVVVRDVRFSYPDGSEIVHGVSLTLSPGSIIGLSGPSGCGKSTLAKIMLGLYPAQSGSVEVGGRIAYVPQDAFLFDDTIRHNILCGRPAASDANIDQVVLWADADAFIRQLPRGYDERVGEDGSLLSGGQRQRIALARAMLAQPDIIILDEPTSALDSLSESQVMRAIRERMPNVTALLISHREQTLRNADLVYQMQDGMIPAVD